MSLRRKPVNPTENTEAAESELCDAHGESTRVRCMLPKGHVKTMDDWHWASAETGSHVITNIFEQRVDSRETHRWRPNMFELPREKLAQALESAAPGTTGDPT